jgi:hypothetical protein
MQVLQIRDAKNRTAEANLDQIMKDRRTRAQAYQQQLDTVKQRAVSVGQLDFKKRDEMKVKEELKRFSVRPGSQQWLKTTSGGRLKVIFPGIEETSVEYKPEVSLDVLDFIQRRARSVKEEFSNYFVQPAAQLKANSPVIDETLVESKPEGSWDVLNGFIGLPSKEEGIKVLEAKAKSASQSKKVEEDRLGQCLKLAPVEQMRSITNAFTYLHLRHEGCPAFQAMKFSSKLRCMTDTTQQIDGPAVFRKMQRKDNHNEGPCTKGWQLHQAEFETPGHDPIKRRDKVDEYEALNELYTKFEQNHVIERGMIMPEAVLPLASFYTTPEYSSMTHQELLQYLKDRRVGQGLEESTLEDKEIQAIVSTPFKPAEFTGKVTPITIDQSLISGVVSGPISRVASRVLSPVVSKKSVSSIHEDFSSGSEDSPLQVEDKIDEVMRLPFGVLKFRALRPHTVKGTPMPKIHEREIYTPQMPELSETPLEAAVITNTGSSQVLPLYIVRSDVSLVTPTANHDVVPCRAHQLTSSASSSLKHLKEGSSSGLKLKPRQVVLAKQLALERKQMKSSSVQSQLQTDLLERVRLKSEDTLKRISTAQDKRRTNLKLDLLRATEELDRKKEKMQLIKASKQKLKTEHEQLAEEKRLTEKRRLREIKEKQQEQIEAQRIKTMSKLRATEAKIEQRNIAACQRRERLNRIS